MEENKKVMKAAELTPTAQKIDRIIKRIDDGDIKIPAFQRGYVWKQDQIISLLDSIVSEYPIGSVLLWKTNEHLKSTRNIAGYAIPEKDDTYPVNYALDGQQRMASIYGVFSRELAQEVDASGYNASPDLFEIYYDFEKDQFLDKSSLIEDESANSILLRQLLDVVELMSALKGLDPAYHKQAQQLASQFLNYEIPVVTIENRNREDVGIIFERINNTGTKLSALDLMTAWTWTDDFHLLDSCNDLLEEIDEKGFGGIQHKTLLQIISAVIQDSTITKNILALSGEQVRENWDDVTENIKRGIDFLATELGCLNVDFLPLTQQLVTLIKFFHLIEKPSADQLKVLKQYFWKTSFSNRYSTGQTSNKMDADIERLHLLSDGDLTAFDDYHYTAAYETFRNTKLSKGNPISRAFLLLLSQNSPVDMVSGVKVDLSTSLAKYNRKEFHHVFPQKHLSDQGLEKDKIFTVLNFAYLSSSSNKTISKKAPSDYFFNTIPQDILQDVLV